MPIYTLEDLREKAPRELRSLSDEELVREYSRRKKRPFEEVADNLGLKPSGFLSEMGRQFMGGLSVDVPRLVGQGQQFLARELPGLTEALEAGAQAQAAAQPAAITAPTSLRPVPSGAVTDIGGMLREEAARAEPRYVPDMRGRGLGQEILLSGMRAVGPVASTVPFSVVPGGMPLAVGGLFGLSQAQDTYEKLIAQGVPEDEARQASYRTGAIQGVGEAAATYIGGKLFKPLLGRVGGATTGEIAAGMTDTGILKPFAKGMATNLLVQPTTEIAQDVGTSMVEQAYGAKPEDLMDIAKQSAMGATGLTLLLGPLAFGAHVSRSNNAAALKAALSDDPTVPREIRAQAIAAVNVEAKRQGIAPRDIASWTQGQIELEDRRTDALRRMAESAQALEVGAGIEQRLGIGAPRLDEASYIQQFEEAFNEPSGQFTYETLPDGSQAPRELTMGEVINRQANTDPNAAKDLLTSNKPKTAREVLAEIRQAANDPLSPSVWRFPVSTGLVGSQRDLFAAGPEAFMQRPVRGELTSAQQAALGGTPPMGAGQITALRGPIDQTAPRPAMGLGAAQQFAAAGPEAQTSATIPSALVAPSGGTPATVSPSAPVAPGSFSTTPAATKAAAPKKTTKPKAAVTPKKPTAPSAIEQALEEELDLADTASDAARVSSILNEVNKEKLGAEVQGAKQIKAPGRVSLSQRSLLGIRDAIFRKSGKVAKAFGRNEQKIVDAVRRFTNAYDAYLNFSTNLSREVKKGIAAKADERMAKMDDLAKEVQNALFALGQSMDNNAKNVEAVVRVVKDAAQRKLATPGKTKAETLSAVKSLDTSLSSGWAAAKRESFMKELPDLADVSGQQIRPSAEMQEKTKGTPVSAIENAAKTGYVNPQGKGEKYTGLAGALQYLRFNTTPMGRVLAKALRDALVESNNPAKISFVDKGGSRYDPKTNTVYINRGEQSAEVVLHETFHAALQWYVYQNPNAPAVKQLQLSLERALGAKGLEGKALEVQVILQELVNKKRGLDAVLELVSYTATLNDFRRAMQEIKTGDAPKSFLESVRSVWAMYKAIVRRMLGVNDTVASDVLSASMDLLEQSTKAEMPTKTAGSVLDIATTAFKRWFGDSKVVDDNGQPLVVYHGTNRSFTAFAKEVLGKATGAPSAKLGFFFAGDPSTSAKYAKNAVRSSRLDSTVIDTYKDMIEKKKAELSEAGFQKAVKSQLRVLNNLYEEEKAQASDAGYSRYLKSRGESLLPPLPKDAYIKERERSAKYYEGRRTELENNPESYREEHNKVVNSEISSLQNILDKEVEAQSEEQKFGEPAGPNIVPVYLSIKNPLVIDQKGDQYRIMSYYDTVRKAQSLGHDGVIIKNTYDGKIPPGWITRLVSKWRNEPVPSDTIYIAFEPNQIKSVFNQTPTEAPGILEAAVQSNKATQQAAGISAQDYRTYRKDIGPVSMITKMFFDAIGWQKGAQAFQKGASTVADMIRKDFPTVERFLIYINSRFSAGELTSQEIENFKVNKNVGYQQMERLANFVLNRPAEQIRALFDYMDGNKKALDNLPDKEIMTRTADNVMDWYQTYIKDLPATERSFFTGRKFSEALLYASKSAQVASSTFGARKLSEVIGLKHRGESTLDGFSDWIAKDENGDLDLNGRFYQVFKSDGLRPGTGPDPAGFMSISEFEKRGRKAPDGFQVDATRQWWLSQYNPDKGYKFSSSMTARQALEENKIDELANAMRNTMAALANNYASRQFSKALAANDSITFDSLEDIKKFSGQIVDEDQVLKVSQEESKSPQIRSMYRRSGTWVKLPDSTAYGDLANKYIPGPVWSAMTDMSDRRPLVDLKAYNAGMRWFKKSKTIYNPGTHVTNIASNITLAMMHDIPMSTLGNAARIFALYEVRPSALNKNELNMMSAFMNSGAMLGNFSSAEVKQSLYDAWKENMNPTNDNSLLKRLSAFTNYEKSKAQKAVNLVGKVGKTADNILTETYAAEDNIFRLAAFLTKAGELQVRDKTNTATPEQLRSAGDFARKAFLDYDIDSKAVRIMRQSFFPFISWPYAIAPVLGRIALHQPWKIANVLMAYWLLETGMAAMGDGDDEELRKAGPEYMRERMFFGSFGPRMFVRIPFMGDAENPVYYKLGDYVPFASITKGLPNGLFGMSGIPSAITPSGPLVSALIGLVGGVDPYSGKDIHKPTDSELDKLVNATKFAYDTMAPSFASSQNYKKIKDIINDKQGITGKEPSNLVFARMLGFKLYEYNVDESLALQDLEVKKIEREFKSEMRKATQDEYAKGYPDYEALDEKIDALQERLDKRIAKIRGEEE